MALGHLHAHADLEVAAPQSAWPHRTVNGRRLPRDYEGEGPEDHRARDGEVQRKIPVRVIDFDPYLDHGTLFPSRERKDSLPPAKSLLRLLDGVRLFLTAYFLDCLEDILRLESLSKWPFVSMNSNNGFIVEIILAVEGEVSVICE